MGDVIAEFFEDLAARGQEPLLRAADATVRLDLADGPAVEHWYVTMRRGRVEVSHDVAEADCVVSAERRRFADFVAGRANIITALLRDEVDMQGYMAPLARLQRLFPAPPPQRPHRPIDAEGVGP